MIESAPGKGGPEATDLLPQAVIARSPSYLADMLHLQIAEGADDLDYYEGLNLILDGIPVAVRHYRGHPSNTSTIYIPAIFKDVSEITKLISMILLKLQIGREEVIWQRADDISL